MKQFFLIFFGFLPALFFGQGADKKSSVLARPDSLKNTQVTHSPKKALLLSLLPGAGQVYNHKYWKVPVIYVAFAGLGYFINSNQQSLNLYKNEYVYRVNPLNNGKTKDPTLVNLTTDDLLTLKQDYERYRNYCIIGVVAVYILNLVDAAVDAHMYTFDVNENLSMQVHPALLYSAQGNFPVTGVGLSLKF